MERQGAENKRSNPQMTENQRRTLFRYRPVGDGRVVCFMTLALTGEFYDYGETHVNLLSLYLKN